MSKNIKIEYKRGGYGEVDCYITQRTDDLHIPSLGFTTKEDKKQLLLKNLSARLPYGIIVYDYDREEIREMGLGTLHDIMFNDLECKPYLRPMSSMTEEEYDQLYIDSRVKEDSDDILDALANDMDAIDWLNAHHFDYRGLIPKCLAIEVTKENNPYEEINL